MSSKARIVFFCTVVGLAWFLGYGMGGGFGSGGIGPDSRHRSQAPTANGNGIAADAASHMGVARAADETLEDQLAARRGKWTPERLRASLGAIGHEPDIVHAVRFALKLTEQLGPEDFPMAIEIGHNAKDEMGDEGEFFEMLALSRWAELNPAAVGQYLQEENKLGGGFIGPSKLDLMLGTWAATNPAGAIAWAKSLKEKSEQEHAINAIVGAVARRDVDEAIALANAYAPEMLKDGALVNAIHNAMPKRDPGKNARMIAELGGVREIESATRRWAGKNPTEAMKWADELTDEKLRTEALKGAWRELGENHFEDAAAKLAQAAADAPFIESIGKAVTQKLAEKDPQAAEHWAATLPQREVREEAYTALGEFYGSKDPEKGGLWLNGLAAGAERDKAIAAFVAKARGNDPAAAIDWAVTIGDGEQRINAVRGALSSWFEASPAAAMEWLQTTPSISEEDRQAILKKR